MSYLGIGTRLATCSVNWLEAREFVILVPDLFPPAKRRARLNTCRSRPVSARCTRCRCFCVFVLVLLSHHKSIGGRLLLLPQAAQDGLALCHLSRQDTSRGIPSQGRHRSKVCACRSLQEPRLTAGAMWRLRVKEDPLVQETMSLFLCRTPIPLDHLRVGAAQEEEVWRRRAL